MAGTWKIKVDLSFGGRGGKIRFQRLARGRNESRLYLAAPVLSFWARGPLLSFPFRRGCFPRQSVIFLPRGSLPLNRVWFPFLREEARLDETARGGAHPTATTNSPPQRCCFSYGVTPSLISPVASGITQGRVLILIWPPCGHWLAVHSTLGCCSPCGPGTHGLWASPEDHEHERSLRNKPAALSVRVFRVPVPARPQK